jgi:hypothetical protein
MEAATSPTPSSGMWAPYEPAEIGESLDILEQVGPFVLLGAVVREGISTQYGPRDAVDLTVQTSEPGKTRLFSGFAAGIVGQCKRVGDGDLPAIAKIVPQATGRGSTRGLELVDRPAAGADLAAIAKACPIPVMPIGGQTNEIPY